MLVVHVEMYFRVFFFKNVTLFPELTEVFSDMILLLFEKKFTEIINIKCNLP